MSPRKPEDDALTFLPEGYDDTDPEALGGKRPARSKKRDARRIEATAAAQAALARWKKMAEGDDSDREGGPSTTDVAASTSRRSSFALPESLAWELRQLVREEGRLVVLTGAGISAESGIPTFRGEDGYWKVGSKNHHPQEMATHAMFRRAPWAVWAWYLHRYGICRSAGPNAAHRAVARLDALFGDRFLLVTQNVDGLHPMAGNPLERCFQVHGDIALMRCSLECTKELVAIPEELATTEKLPSLPAHVQTRLHCSRCGAPTRPHVLWFDECYDEEYYHFDGAMTAALSADALVVVGSSGSTTLPARMAMVAAQRGILLVDVNPDDNYFGDLAAGSPRGFVLRSPASTALEAIATTCETL